MSLNLQQPEKMLQGKSIICFAGEDWWYHHPHSKNHIMKRLARTNKVMFVNSISMGLPSIGSRDFFTKVKRKLRSYVKFLRRSPEGVWVVTPIVTPFFSSNIGRAVNKLFLVFQIRLLMLVLGFRNPILWIAIPTARDVVGKLGESLLIYQVSDKYDANTMDHGDRRALIKLLDEDLQRRAEIVYFSGRKLFQEAKYVEKSYLLEQAVDFDHFARATAEQLSPPSDIVSIPRPILGYFGAIESWLIDASLIRYVSQKRPHWHWVFLGLKTGKLGVEELANVHFLGSKNYYDLPAYASSFDVCVLPWVTDNEFVSYGSAIKVREYLATGKPVVITPLYEYKHLSGVLRIAESYDHFIELCEEAIQEDSMSELRKLRQDAVRDSTWDKRVEQVSQLIEQKLSGQTLGKDLEVLH
ncbi:MAG: glycosyltransferase [Acidobacteriota bacterium]|nr:glycosyltransferase [Blastocatellia bacterium]MDW8413719.1 glycosyltransferase [Acidobacteriota bacterium]